MFKGNAVTFLKKALGEDGFEQLSKSELFKKKTNTALDIGEIRTALQIVPRTILTLLQKELGEMKDGEGKEFKLPVEPEAFLSVTKYAKDVYSGEIRQKGDIVANFKYRSLPGVGLVIMSTFELYDMMDLGHMGKQAGEDKDLEQKIQSIIEEKLRMRDIISSAVEKKISEREAVSKMINHKLTEMFSAPAETQEEPVKIEKKAKEPSKLKGFLEKQADKKKAGYSISLEKSESVICPDCGNKIFDQSGFSGCVCFGEDMQSKIHIKKSEDGLKISFSKNWDPENIEMLLEVLRERSNRSKK